MYGLMLSINNFILDFRKSKCYGIFRKKHTKKRVLINRKKLLNGIFSFNYTDNFGFVVKINYGEFQNGILKTANLVTILYENTQLLLFTYCKFSYENGVYFCYSRDNRSQIWGYNNFHDTKKEMVFYDFEGKIEKSKLISGNLYIGDTKLVGLNSHFKIVGG